MITFLCPFHGPLKHYGSMSQVVGLSNNSYKHITNTAWVRARLCRLQKKVHSDSQPQVIKFTSCLPIVDGSHRVLRILPPLTLVSMIQLKVALNTKNLSIKYYVRVGPLPKLRKFKNIDLLTTSLVVFEAKDNACPMIECMVFLHQQLLHVSLVKLGNNFVIADYNTQNVNKIEFEFALIGKQTRELCSSSFPSVLIQLGTCYIGC